MACRRHIKYGVKAAHYEHLTAAIAATLGEVLGPRWAGPEKDAWVALVGVLHTLVAQVYGAGAICRRVCVAVPGLCSGVGGAVRTCVERVCYASGAHAASRAACVHVRRA